MAEFYNAETLLEFVKQNTPHIDGETTIKCVERAIKEAPTADVVEVKHGEWINRQKIYGVGVEYVCSVCEKGIRQYEGQPICSECGAKMDGGKKE